MTAPAACCSNDRSAPMQRAGKITSCTGKLRSRPVHAPPLELAAEEHGRVYAHVTNQIEQHAQAHIKCALQIHAERGAEGIRRSRSGDRGNQSACCCCERRSGGWCKRCFSNAKQSIDFLERQRHLLVL